MADGARSHPLDYGSFSTAADEAFEHLQQCKKNEANARERLRAKLLTNPANTQALKDLEALYAEVDVLSEETQEAGGIYITAALQIPQVQEQS